MATLPKPRYPAFGSGGPAVWPPPLRPWENRSPVVSASSSLLGLQAQAPVLPSEPLNPEPGIIAHLSVRLRQAGRLLRALAEWWMEADFRRRQVPVLVLALGVWGISAGSAWRSQESGTPLLSQRLANLHVEQARTAINAGITLPRQENRVAPAAPARGGSASLPQAAVGQSTAPQAASNVGGNLATLLAASLDSLFDAEPAQAEKVAGNPRRRVWVDMKTGLYYCPGASHYRLGGRSRGKVMTQKDAEYAYFQPATGASCR